MAAEAVLAFLNTQRLRKFEAAVKGKEILGLKAPSCLVPSSANIQCDVLLKVYQNENLLLFFLMDG